MKQIWGLVKWTKDRTSKFVSFTPPLQNSDKELVFRPEDKAEALAQSFFAHAKDADLSDTENFSYPEPLVTPPFQEDKIGAIIDRVAADKAPGPDSIPKRAFKLGKVVLNPILTAVFNLYLYSGYCLEHFWESTTIALRKLGKDDYSEAKSYRQIALLNTIGKLLETAIASRVSYYAETHLLIPDTHYGGQRRSSQHRRKTR
jgi:hypothetical protein